MRLHFKQELVFGLASILIVVALIAISIMQYEKNIALSTVPGTISVTPGASLTVTEIAKHNAASDCWIIIEKKVYAVTDFLARHPGGAGLIIPYCGKDATQPFLTRNGRGSHSAEAMRLLGLIYIGDLNGGAIANPNMDSIKTIPINADEDDD